MMMESESQVKLEDALAATGFGKFNYALIVLAGAVLGSTYLEIVNVNFILPVAQCELDMTMEDKGLLSSITAIGVLVSLHFWGFLADTRGRKAVMVPTLLLTFLMTILCSLANNFFLIMLFKFLNGVW